MITGSCLCGAIHYRIEVPLGPVTPCHCSQCRKSTGHFSAATPVKWEDLSLEGELNWYDSTPGKARRGFCSTCGSYMIWEEFDGLAYISAGTMDNPTGLSIDAHIFYADKGDYYHCDDGVPCYAQGRSSVEIAP